MNEIEGLKMHIDCAIDRLNELHKEVLGYTDYSLLMDAVQAGAIFYDKLAALRAQPEPDGWIDTSDRMPAQHERVIVFVAGDSDVGYLEVRTWKSAYRDGWCVPLNHITHWRPLPSPPREGKI